jgi:hypothetical protein
MTLAALAGCGESGSQSAGSAAPQGGATVTITSPAPATEVPQKQEVTGTAKNIPADKDLWIITRKGTKTHPQSSPTKINADGTWTQTAYVGSPTGDGGTAWDILVYLVPKAGSATITSYLQEAATTGKYPGMAPPEGSTEVAKVPVVKQA